MSAPEAPGPTAGVKPRPTPYQGLVPYTEADAEWFFGREEWTEVVADNFRAYRVTVLYGVSGVGKSSLLRAGLLRHLGDEARENVAAVGSPRLLPVGFSAWSLDAPVAALKETVHGAAERISPELALDSPEGALAEFLEAWPALVEGQLFVVLDQLEELFSYHEDPGDPVLEELADALRSRNPAVHFLLSIREDALAGLDRFEGTVPGLGEHLLRLEHLDRDAALEAIVLPLELWNRTVAAPGEEVEIEPSLIEAVLEQVTAGKVTLGEDLVATSDESAGVESPYLQLVLTRLWDEERRNGSRVLRLETFERLGGADRIVRTHLDTALAALPVEDQDLAGRTFRYLVTPSGTKIAHRIADLADYAQASPEQIDEVVGRLTGEARVLRPAGDGRYEIYHDALVGPIVDWRRRWDERQRRRRERRRLAILAGVAATLAGIAVAIGILAVVAWQARQDAQAGQSKALAGQAITSLDDDAVRSLELAVEAAEAAPTSQAEGALRVTLANFLLRRTFRGHTGAVRNAVFNADGRLIVTVGDDGTARVWDTDSGGLRRTLSGDGRPLTSAAFNRDGTLFVTCGYDETCRLWDAENRALVKTLSAHKGPVLDAAFNAKGDRLVSAGYDGKARIWDTDTGRALRTLDAEKAAGSPGPVYSAAFSPDGTSVVTANGYDGNIRVWRTDTGRLESTLGGHRGAVHDAVFSSDGRLIASAGSDGTARVWDARTRRLVHVLSGHSGPVLATAFDSDNTRVITAGSDGTARIWDTEDGRLIRVLGSGGTVFSAAFSPDNKFVVTAGDETAKLWDISAGRPLHILDARADGVRSAAFSPDGKRVVTAGDERTAAIWDAQRGRRLHTIGGHAGPVESAAFSPDGRFIVAAGDDGRARIWDTEKGRLVHVLDGHRGTLETAAFSPDGELVVTAGGDRTARIWNVGNGRLVHALRGYDGPVVAAAFSHDSRLVVTVGKNGRVDIWAADSGRLLHSIVTRAPLRNVAFSPDGTVVAAASDDGTVWLWGTDNRWATTDELAEWLRTLTAHDGPVRSATFSPDGTLLLTASDDGVARIWDIANGFRRLRTLNGHGGPVRSAVFSPDGKLVLTASDDWTARIWDTNSGRSLQTLTVHADAVNSTAFSADERFIVTASEDGTAAIWTCDRCGAGVPDLLAPAKERLESSQ